jgi:hypothetical protein
MVRSQDLRDSKGNLLSCHLKLAVHGQSIVVKYFHYHGSYRGSRTPG